jgi:hypothetical protein
VSVLLASSMEISSTRVVGASLTLKFSTDPSALRLNRLVKSAPARRRPMPPMRVTTARSDASSACTSELLICRVVVPAGSRSRVVMMS